jgi:hypothetical protein
MGQMKTPVSASSAFSGTDTTGKLVLIPTHVKQISPVMQDRPPAVHVAPISESSYDHALIRNIPSQRPKRLDTHSRKADLAGDARGVAHFTPGQQAGNRHRGENHRPCSQAH